MTKNKKKCRKRMTSEKQIAFSKLWPDDNTVSLLAIVSYTFYLAFVSYNHLFFFHFGEKRKLCHN